MRGWLLVVCLLALLPVERRASACCLGCPCTKYQQPSDFVEIPATGYTHSVRGALPSWSVSRIARFLMSGYWRPFPVPAKAQPTLDTATVYERPASDIKFVAPDHVEAPSVVLGTSVLVRRIEKHGTAILVEVNDRTWKLSACPKKRGYVCLVDPGKLALDPIPAVSP